MAVLHLCRVTQSLVALDVGQAAACRARGEATIEDVLSDADAREASGRLANFSVIGPDKPTSGIMPLDACRPAVPDLAAWRAAR